MKKNFTLLVVNDNPADVALIKASLCELPLELVSLTSTALSTTSPTSPEYLCQPDLVLVDDAFCDQASSTALDSLKASVLASNPNILLLSSLTDTSDIDRLIALFPTDNSIDIISKPLHQTLLFNRIKTQLALIKNTRTEQKLFRLQLKMQEMGELVGLVGHEVASPIGNINTAVSFLLESTEQVREHFDEKKLAAEEMDRFLQRLHKALSMCTKNCGNAGAIINSFRNVASHQCFKKLSPFYLHRYIDDIVLTLKSKLKKLPHEIHIVVGESIELTSYPGALSQVISSLINKSVTHGFDDKIPGTIIISSAESVDEAGRNKVTINYIDDGKGMNDQQQADIFCLQNIDSALHSSAKPRQYLTTAMLKCIVEEQLQGTMQVSSNPGSGIHYTLELPKVITEDPQSSSLAR